MFTYLGSSVSSTETNINTRLAKSWSACDRLSVIWKSDLTGKMKCSVFQAAIVSILLYGWTTWTLTKQMEKKLDVNYTRMLRYKSWIRPPTKQQQYGHRLPIMQTIKIRRTNTRDTAGEVWTSSWVMCSCGPLHLDEQKQGVQLEPTYISYVSLGAPFIRPCATSKLRAS